MAQPVKYDELPSAWSKDQWKPFYVFAGGEDFLMDEAADRAVRHWLTEDAAELNLDKLDASEHEVSSIIEACRTVPFLSDSRVVRVDHAEELAAKDQDRLAEVLKGLSSDTHVLFLWRKDWRRDDVKKPVIEAALEGGGVAIFWPLFPEQAQRWVVQ